MLQQPRQGAMPGVCCGPPEYVSTPGLRCPGLRFDAVVASEVIEHVDDVAGFCASLAALAEPGGGVVISTINRTLPSYALAIVAAEYVLGLVPKGTHQWERFITPGAFCRQCSLPCE